MPSKSQKRPRKVQPSAKSLAAGARTSDLALVNVATSIAAIQQRIDRPLAFARTVPSASRVASGSHRQHLDLGKFVLDVEPVGVASAREDMSSLVKASAEEGRSFLIHNARDPGAASALLIDPAVLAHRLAAGRRRRTLGELVASLPFAKAGLPRLSAVAPDSDDAELRRPATRLQAVGR